MEATKGAPGGLAGGGIPIETIKSKITLPLLVVTSRKLVIACTQYHSLISIQSRKAHSPRKVRDVANKQA